MSKTNKQLREEFRDKVLVHGSNSFISEIQDNPELIMEIFNQVLKQQREEIICSAIKTSGNVVIRGHRHSDCIRTLEKMKNSDYKKIDMQGFITSKNRFVGRKEAMGIQIEAGKMPKDNRGIDLFSEDVY